MTNYDLITLGETMWRLSPPRHQRLDETRSLDVHPGGAESNVAVGLARLGKRTVWWSRLPDNPMGHHLANAIRAQGVDVSGVRWGEGRLGTYYLEFGSAPRATQVYYDRAGSSASQMQPDDFDWSLLRQTSWLHLTGITPALSHSCLETVRRAIHEAKVAGISISFDVNYRAKLWTMAQARPILDEIASQSTLTIVAERDARNCLNNTQDTHDSLTRTLHERWQGTTVVLTRSERGAYAFDGHESCDLPAYSVTPVDQIGTGDAFDVGLLSALMDGKPLAEAMRYGTAVAALKLTIPGDFALVTPAEVEHLLSESPGGVLR